MEGTVPTTRKSKETHQQKKTKVQKKGKKEEVLAEEKGKVKPEPGLESSAFDGTAENGEVAVKTEEAGEEIVVKAEPGIKEEDTTDDGFYGSSHGYFQGQSQLYQAPEEMQM